MALYSFAYVSALAIFTLVDIAWLTAMSSRFYRPILGDILLAGVNLKAALAFYLFYPAGLVIFAVAPAVKSGDLKTAAIMGALLGLFSYGTYDLTNQATLRNWTTALTLADMAWGTFVSGAAAYAAAWITSRLT